jgi:esterase FrsA
MNDVAELKEYVRVHAKGQGIRDYPVILDRIVCDEGGGPASWVGEWCADAEQEEARGHDLQAARRYALAAFPFIDGAARRDAHHRCVSAMQRWTAGQRDIEPLEVALDEGVVRGWAAGLGGRGRPLVIVMGGIVTLKEQWAPILPGLRRLGLAGVVTEMPSVGENSVRYSPDSWRMVSGLLDALADRADVTRTHLIALSFSGHMALRCAAEDPRIASVITVGAPIGPFFTDREWQSQLPRITVDTLAHLTQDGNVTEGLESWALDAEQLSSLDADVWYVANRRDDIIPPGDAQLLVNHVRRLSLLEHDDVHGSPNHIRETQLWTLASLLKSTGNRHIRAALFGLFTRLAQTRRRFS